MDKVNRDDMMIVIGKGGGQGDTPYEPPKTGFDSIRQGTMAITFDNGVRVSIHWSAGSYSDNSDLPFETRLKTGYELGAIQSSNAEVMITTDPAGKVIKWFEKKYGDNPAGYLTVSQVLGILNKAAGATAESPIPKEEKRKNI